MLPSHCFHCCFCDLKIITTRQTRIIHCHCISSQSLVFNGLRGVCLDGGRATHARGEMMQATIDIMTGSLQPLFLPCLMVKYGEITISIGCIPWSPSKIPMKSPGFLLLWTIKSAQKSRITHDHYTFFWFFFAYLAGGEAPGHRGVPGRGGALPAGPGGGAAGGGATSAGDQGAGGGEAGDWSYRGWIWMEFRRRVLDGFEARKGSLE